MDLKETIRASYGVDLDEGYLRLAMMFNEADKGKRDLQVHHVCPRCCGGKDDSFNLVRVTFQHHRKLHNMILMSNLTPEQRCKLEWAYKNMRG